MRGLAVSVASIIVLLAVPSGHHAAASPPAFNRTFTSLLPTNDLQNVVNSTGCAWNDMDELADLATGKMTAGSSTSVTECQITDYGNDGFYPRLFVVETSGVSAVLTNDRGGSWVVPTVKGVGSLCIADPTYSPWSPNPADYPPLPDAPGGVGRETHWTLTLTAVKSGQAYGVFDVAPSDSDGQTGYYRQLTSVRCPSDP